MFRSLSESRWPRLALVVLATLAIPAIFLAGPARGPSGLSVELAGALASGSSTTLDFRVLIPSGHRAERGDGFRIVDVPGYIPGSAQAPPGWEVAVERTSPGTPPPRFDNPVATNLAFTYRGPGPIAGPAPLRGFSARSTAGNPGSVRGYLGRITRAVPSSRPEAVKVASAGEVRGPGKVPEPGSLVSTCLGVLILGFIYASAHRRRLRGSQAANSLTTDNS